MKNAPKCHAEPFASLMAGSSLVILSAAKNPFHSALRVDFAKHLALHRNQQHRFFAEFTPSRQSEILRFAQNDSEGLRMTA